MEESLRILEEMTDKSECDFSAFDWQELAKYVRVVCEDDQIEKAGVSKNLPTRYSNKGQKPTITYLETDTVKVQRKGKGKTRKSSR